MNKNRNKIARHCFILLLCFLSVIYMKAENKDTKAKVLRNAGVSCYNKEQYADAIDLLIRCMEEAKRTGEKDVYCQCLNDIGYVYIRINDMERGIYYFKKGYEMAKETGNKDLQGQNATSLVNAFCFNDDPKTAKHYFKLQKALPRKDKRLKVFFELFSTALIAQTEGENALAVHYYKKAIDYATYNGMGDKHLSYTYGLLVYTSLAENDTAEAKANAKKYYTYASKKKNKTAEKTYFEMMRDINAKAHDSIEVKHYCHLIDSIDKVLIDEQQLKRVGNRLIEFEDEVNKENISLLNDKIDYQQLAIIIFVTMTLLLAAMTVIVTKKERNLRKAFRLLIKKNEDMTNSEKKNKQLLEQQYGGNTPKTAAENNGAKQAQRNDIGLTQEAVDALLNKILAVMENVEIISKPDFNLSQLAQMVESNTKYVSWTINDTYKKNFKTLLNEYRIREACNRLKDTEHYGNMTIQAIYKDLGYSSASNFITAFKNVNGMTPSVYMRLARNQT